MNGDLPAGWASAKLGEISELNPRHPRTLAENLKVSFAPMAAVNESKPAFNYLEDRLLGAVRTGFTHFAEGDVLFAKITPCMENGKGAVARGLQNGLGCGTTELHVFRPKGGISSDYVYCFLSQPAVRREAKEHFTGSAGQGRVPLDFMADIEIPLAPIAEQRRIGAKLEGVLGKVDACQRRLEKIPTILKRFRQSVLAAACSGRLTAEWREANSRAKPPRGTGVDQGTGVEEGFPEGWKSTQLGSLATLVTSGSRGWAKFYSPSGSTFIRAQNISADFLDLRDAAFVKLPRRAEGLRTKVEEHDLLVTITGANVTKAAIVDQVLTDAYVSQHVALIRLADGDFSEFLFYFLLSEAHGRGQLQKAAYGQGKPGLNLDNIRELELGLPPKLEQQEIVRRVRSLFTVASRIAARYQSAKAAVDTIPQSVLAKAFRGELVPTEAELAELEGRSFESAEELLVRIRAKESPARDRKNGRPPR